MTNEEAFTDLKNTLSKKAEVIVYRCKDCSKYNLCYYYHRRKETSQICHYFALPEREMGKWVLHQNPIDWGWDIDCSVCGKGDKGFFANGRENAEYKLKHQFLMDAKKRDSMRYCNYCGAKMEVDE